MRVYPNEPVCRNYKIKEQYVVSLVKERFPELTWVCDKKYDFSPIECGSKRRPDMYCNFGNYVLIVEVDENQHMAYDTTCDNRRLCELYQDFNYANIIFIRFNPDGYIDQDDKKVTSCFGYDKNGNCTIRKSKVNELVNRMDILCDSIGMYTCLNKPPEKSITVESLFYDKNT
jgi:hypothetical protein